jgi:membrane-bound lytic murein transglycosylase B
MAVALVACAVIPGAAQAACSTAVTRASATAGIPPDYLVLYQRWGGAYGVPWQLLAAVGSVESRHGRDPRAYVPHTRGVLGPM